MNTRWLIVPAAALALLAVPLAAEHANAENVPAAPAEPPAAAPPPAPAPETPPPEGASAGATGDASAAEPPDGGADAAPAPSFPMFNEMPFPDAPTPAPKAKEWESAQRVVFDSKNTGPLSSSCQAHRLREWIRLRCTGPSIGAISLLGGNSDGLTFQLDPITNEWISFPEGAQMVFPVRRGDRRVIEWLQVSWGYRGANSIEPYLVLSEHWLPEDEKPTIVLW
jgi:hypothetical protein